MKQDTECKLLEETAELFKALGDTTRMQMINILASGEKKNVSVTELANMMNITQPAVSQHQKPLKMPGLCGQKKSAITRIICLTRSPCSISRKMSIIYSDAYSKNVIKWIRKDKHGNVDLLFHGDREFAARSADHRRTAGRQ